MNHTSQENQESHMIDTSYSKNIKYGVFSKKKKYIYWNVTKSVYIIVRDTYFDHSRKTSAKAPFFFVYLNNPQKWALHIYRTLGRVRKRKYVQFYVLYYCKNINILQNK